jgi:uncharacterized protein YcgI (DUF1989 family)
MNLDQDYQLLNEHLLAPHTGTAIVIRKGQVLRLIDVEGQQVVDLTSYSYPNPLEYLSSPRTMDYNNKIYFTTDDVLYSNQSKPMWTITEDSVGKHCFLFAPCDQRMFEITYGIPEPHPNCFDNLSSSLSKFGIQPTQIFVPFNIFMNAEINNEGEIEIHPPTSRPGDSIDLRAEQDLIVGISACSAYKSNNYTFGQIKLQIYSREVLNYPEAFRC